ncbi:Metallo peptidase M20 [Heterobasidion irregulare TC 32-1]|uniref:Metallo peptidase M20 n=1 Tax=Heterobasidion irregulare (strain TC 32-1) TaxID=747525 RepID=W4JZJ2_HETIT|nr:Metallo peptidase M20 [Heterobasidion irregulare TC 32-1]ETW78967.1 Metallo peptidase M20 [Heterobasidion irregulare TC 32-1]
MEPVGVDPRWDAFGPFHDYLAKAYPLIHSKLEITKVNTYGLIYVWKGSDESLKPLLLAAHQDVVPVDPRTVDEWEHPPYSGHFDGESVWGRGSSDDKSGLIGVMSTIESLLEKDFHPTRGIVLSFGFDEETSGLHGASKLAEYLLSTYGENSFALLVDEGGSFSEQHGSIIATPGIAEKGYIDTRIEVASPGGHSSIPPSHTSIGILSALLVELEAHPFEVHLSRGTPVYATVQCLAAHAKNLPQKLRASIKASAKSDKALKKAEKELFVDPAFKALVGTTQAIDLIQGGVKTNALPEQAWAVVNHRLATESSVAETKHRDTEALKVLAQQFNLSYTAFGAAISAKDAPAYGSLTLTDAWGTALEPAPITPTDSDAVPYRILSGTIRATYDSHRDLVGGDNIFVSPGIMSGNTDTRYYWKLTSHIFRYNHHNSGNGSALANGVHTVNEHIRIVDFVEIIRYFTTLILNVDESTEV